SPVSFDQQSWFGGIEMKKGNKLTALGIVLVLVATTASIVGQTQTDPQKARPRTTTTTGQDKDKKTQKPVVNNGERLEPDDTARNPADVPDDVQANRQEQ